MTTPRFYCPQIQHATTEFELPPAAAHHANRVLRLRVNDEVRLFDGIGNEFLGNIRTISDSRVALQVLQVNTISREPLLCITLAQALCSNEKIDWVMQKATELGAVEVQPLQTKRSMKKLTGERAEKRVQHWVGVAIAACEQCGQNTLPKIHPPLEFSAWCATLANIPDKKFILLPEAVTTLSQQPKPQGPVILLIGPEGGFSAEETQLAQQVGFTPIRLGARILRTETAAMAGMAALQTLWGDFI
ncbi:MAG: 16S rRNA (uracil(1498)-N(3))-methyltransferase [Candidatus Nitrotoga sp.]|jgi:16S rRNA (uracil1498-N3)-methyltransferase|nr:16S rRNA (uracil(1498)-N(3))-methyltransferase [Candidatus Nitrotoga sp.]MDW7626032.1 16S rRNA (uracil(1498)-N(3))-methyltransferase [Candidatus Nitrotoga sp.]